MRVRVKTVLQGPGPSEAVVSIRTRADREEEVVVHRDQIEDDTLQVWPIGEKGGELLVELPQESASGNLRLWIDRQQVAVP
jgi:hypothetical protein